MLRKAGKANHDFIGCKSSNLLNALQVSNYELKDRDAFMACHARRMSFSRKSNVRIISSFTLDKDLIISAYMQRKNLTIDEVDRSGSDYKKHKKGFKISWGLDYMGYSNFRDAAFKGEERCPITDSMNQVVEIAVEDTYLPISHDLPCISRKLLKEMIGLDISEELKLNVRNGRKKTEWEMELSCIDIAISKGMTVKLVKLYDGTDLNVADWRSGARRAEERCVAKTKAI